MQEYEGPYQGTYSILPVSKLEVKCEQRWEIMIEESDGSKTLWIALALEAERPPLRRILCEWYAVNVPSDSGHWNTHCSERYRIPKRWWVDTPESGNHPSQSHVPVYMKCLLSLEGFNSSSKCILTLEFNALSRGVGILERFEEYGCGDVAVWRTVFLGQDASSKKYLKKSGLQMRLYQKTIFSNIYTSKTSINCCLTHSFPGFKRASSHTCHMT
jgi:hypothetical protein